MGHCMNNGIPAKNNFSAGIYYDIITSSIHFSELRPHVSEPVAMHGQPFTFSQYCYNRGSL